MGPPFQLRRLRADDAGAYRALRLEALQRCPTAFGSSWEEESAQPLPWFAERLEGQWVLGGWRDDGRLCGTACLYAYGALKMRHKASIVGVYVCPEARGSGLARALIQQLVERARGRYDMLTLTVEASNAAAHRLYERMGFREYGREPRALKIGGVFHDEILMALSLQAAGPGSPP